MNQFDVGCTGCVGGYNSKVDAGDDAGSDAAADAGVDAGVDAGADAGPPPTVALSDVSTGSTTVTADRVVQVDTSNDNGATAWCISESQPVAPASPSATCVGGSGPMAGWATTRPTTFTLSPCEGVKTVFLWVAHGAQVSSTGASASIQLRTDVTSGLTSWWKFDETSGTVASDSVGNAAGDLVNGPTWVPGHLGGALAFDGIDDLVSFANGGPLIATQSAPFSVSAWFNLTNYSATEPDIIQMRSDTAAPFHLLLSQNPAWDGVSLGAGIGPWVCMRTNVEPPLGIWHHVVMTFDGADAGAVESFTIFVDGVAQPIEATGGYGTQANETHIGTAEGGANQWTGLLDDLRIYNRTLTSAEVGRLFALCY
jgi:hypothetical protein